ncbi:MAG TPA: histidine--tRNA ligase [Tepidisphaeraceae bacterium]|jgi:histidyl-tRNA synthetase|nr:histidine--tRNA ligase [Tepidisphaeraceae bacterium]
MSKINAPRGTADTLPSESWKWQAIEAIARDVAGLYHFAEIRTPIYEHSDLFHRGVGETTDIVSKETFTFADRGGDSITLRPEGTAGVVRAVIENNLVAQEGSRQKLFYIGPNFRYERPQKGRLRQHHQFGVEAFGITEPEQDAECILLQLDFYRRCGLKDFVLHINSLGDSESKQRFAQHVVDSLTPHKASLSEDSQRRLSSNPLRILDSKDPRDTDLTSKLFGLEFLSPASAAHLDRVQKLLAGAGADFVVDGQLVRGFDYYTGTLWEVTTSGLGSQNAIGGGGRYDNLVERLGGRPTPGVGFGVGIERLLMALDAQQAVLPDSRRPLVWLVAHGDAARQAAWNLLAELRTAGVPADMDLANRSMKAQFKIADREAAKFCAILGDDELAKGEITLKNLSTGQQSAIPRTQIISQLRSPPS